MEDFVMKNPNLYITLAPAGGIWSSNTYPWILEFPWSLNAPN